MIDRCAPLIVAGLALLGLAAPGLADGPRNALDFDVKDIDGKPVNLAQAHAGKVVLIVNTASKCGYTPQYKELEEVYRKYKGQGFEVLAFPANEFGGQEPGSDAEIKSFCTENYAVSFPLYSKIVVKGKGIHPLYEYLTSPTTDPKFAGPIKWNFNKFLVDRRGQVVARFDSKDKPDAAGVTKAIEGALAEAR